METRGNAGRYKVGRGRLTGAKSQTGCEEQNHRRDERPVAVRSGQSRLIIGTFLSGLQEKAEGTSLAHLTFDTYRAAMRVDNMFYNGETESGSTDFA